MSVQLPPATHRKRALPQGELEAASQLKLGADQHTHTLSLSEARLVIHKVLENKRRGGGKYEEPEYVTGGGCAKIGPPDPLIRRRAKRQEISRRKIMSLTARPVTLN